MAVTSQQIAQIAGVSRGTVDRALHNRGRVNPEVAARILKIAEELGYRPNSIGQALAGTKRNLKLGAILQSSETPTIQDVAAGVRHAAAELRESGVELELREYKKYLTYEREHNLGRMPLKIDLLIIKKRRDIVIKNDIADFFLGNNILEYKSPGDDVNAGTFYKALSYACLYKAESGAADIFDADTTVSIVREEKPVKLLGQLSEKYSVTKKKAGIYRIDGMIFPMQVLVTKELARESHVWITSLTRTLSREDARELLDNCAGLGSDEDRRNADSVVNVASEANIVLL